MISLFPPTTLSENTITLEKSKSEANRMLVLQALFPEKIVVSDIGGSDDSKVLQKEVNSINQEINIGHAGTAMRFLTAFFAIQKRETILTGSSRMHQRPIALLVNSLIELGADIEYLKESGFPPLIIRGQNFTQKTNEISISGEVSSQFISALLLIAPSLPQGLILTLAGKILSRPYIKMTYAILQKCGARTFWVKNKIGVMNGNISRTKLAPEGDWSGASYWYSLLGLMDGGGPISLSGLRKESLQGDSVIAKIFDSLGVCTEFTKEGITLRKKEAIPTHHFEYDFSKCPDLVQTVAPYLVAKNISFSINGLETLAIKETDRINALIQELGKLGSGLTYSDKHLIFNGHNGLRIGKINTYSDHRMALGFAPLCSVIPGLMIDSPEVVSKSYPDYWKDLMKIGIRIVKQ